MIEMHVGDDSLGDDGDEYSPYPGRGAQLRRLAFSAPSLAIASLVIGFASLTVVRSADDIGEIALFGSNNNVSNLTQLRVSAAVQLVIALIAVALAVASGLGVRATENDEDLDAEPSGPLWVRAVAGSGLLVGLLAVVLSGITLIYALHAHTGIALGG